MKKQINYIVYIKMYGYEVIKTSTVEGKRNRRTKTKVKKQHISICRTVWSSENQLLRMKY